jgi:hypothetical protein
MALINEIRGLYLEYGVILAPIYNPESANVIDINEHRWKMHCRGLFHLPIAAWIANSPETALLTWIFKLSSKCLAGLRINSTKCLVDFAPSAFADKLGVM